MAAIRSACFNIKNRRDFAKKCIYVFQIILELMAIISQNSFDQTVLIMEMQYFFQWGRSEIFKHYYREEIRDFKVWNGVMHNIFCKKMIWKLLYTLSFVNIRLQARRPEFDSWQEKGLPSSSLRPYRFWSLSNILISGYLKQNCRCMKLNTHLHPVRRLRISGAVPSFLHTSSWSGAKNHRDQFTLYLRHWKSGLTWNKII